MRVFHAFLLNRANRRSVHKAGDVRGGMGTVTLPFLPGNLWPALLRIAFQTENTEEKLVINGILFSCFCLVY